jgi:hypothetical protein
VKAYISRRAARAAERIDSYPTERHPALRRVLLSKSGCHLSFEVDEVMQAIRILHVWDGRREREPKL